MNIPRKKRNYFSTIIMSVTLVVTALFGGCAELIEDESTADVSRSSAVITEAFTDEQTEAELPTETEQSEDEAPDEEIAEITDTDESYVEYHFRNQKLLTQHFEKHGAEFADDFAYETAAEYEKGASDVINSDDALYKTEAEDGDGVYYIEGTNEFVILSTDGYIRTYFRPNAGIDYFNRQ